MAYRSEPIPELNEWVHGYYKHVKLGFMLTEKISPELKEGDVREATKGYELIIAAYVYPEGTKLPLKSDFGKPAIAFAQTSVDYANVIKAYNPRSIIGTLRSHVTDELLDGVLAELNAPLALEKNQLIVLQFQEILAQSM